MKAKEGATTAENIRYVELAARPVLPLVEETAQAVEQLQDIKAQRKVKFPRFRGHRNICVSGVRDVEETPPIPA